MTTVNGNESKYVDYLTFSPLSWKRPEGPPRVWRVVDGRRKMPDGTIPRFSIQEVPKDLEDDVVEFMVKHFIDEEATCADQGVSADALALREFRTFWKDIVSQGISIVALTVNSDPTAKPVIAGVNVLIVITADDNDEPESVTQLKTRAVRTVVGVQYRLFKECNVLGRYGVDRYLGAFGLSVDPTFRGQGLGEELLRARDDIGRAYQIPVTETGFTGIASQIVAARVGFEVLLDKKYSELLDEEGKVAFPGVTVESMKVMGKRLY